jgi:protein-disulfide isomerase
VFIKLHIDNWRSVLKNKKSNILLFSLVVSALILAITSLGSRSPYAEESVVSAAQKEEIEKIIYNYLMENPQVIFEAADKYRANEEEIQARMFNEKLGQYKESLTKGPYSPSIGPDDADITIVEFFDYNCGYCKKAIDDIQGLIKDDKNVRIVFKEMPILSPASRTAAQWALAANKQGKYWEFHQKLMTYRGNKDEKALEKLAKDAGVDVKKLREDLKDPEINKQIDNNLEITRDLGIRGTPAFIINNFLARGYMGLDSMKSTIKNIREENG